MVRTNSLCDIALMRESDIGGIVFLEQESGGNWTEPMFSAEYEHPASLVLVARGMAQGVAESRTESGIIGFICSRVVADEAEIFKLAVAITARRQGVATFLLEYALVLARQAGAATCYLELRANNTPARRLYEHHGFVASGERRNYYSDPQEDALLMKLKL